MSIIHAFLEWVSALLTPRPRGRHRAERTLAAPPLFTPPAPPAQPTSPRSPYGGYGRDEPLNGNETSLVRPYLVAHEERERQRERRLVLLLALDGVDVGPEVIHGVRLGAAVAA
jgi:hypothetical protein